MCKEALTKEKTLMKSMSWNNGEPVKVKVKV